MLDLLGSDILGRKHESGLDAPGVIQDGGSGHIDNWESGSSMPKQTKSTLPLAGEDEQTDQEESISTSDKGQLLRGSLNPRWKGYNKRGNGKVSEPHKRKRSTLHRERSPFNGDELFIQKQEDKVRGDYAAYSGREEMQ